MTRGNLLQNLWDWGYTLNDATGYIFKCLDGLSSVTFNTSRYGVW
jgi:hypothetical protein